MNSLELPAMDASLALEAQLHAEIEQLRAHAAFPHAERHHGDGALPDEHGETRRPVVSQLRKV